MFTSIHITTLSNILIRQEKFQLCQSSGGGVFAVRSAMHGARNGVGCPDRRD